MHTAITFGTHYPNRLPGCVICSSPTISGLYVCSSCNLDQLNRRNEVSPELREAMEQEEQRYLSSFQEKVAWHPASGYFNISGLIQLTGRSPRWIWKMSRLSGLTPAHNGHQAVWTEEQAQAFLGHRMQCRGAVLALAIRDDNSIFMAEVWPPSRGQSV